MEIPATGSYRQELREFLNKLDISTCKKYLQNDYRIPQGFWKEY